MITLRMGAALMIAVLLFTSAAFAQDADAVLARAERINKFMALLAHEDSSVRIAALEQGLQSDDRLLRSRAMDAGLTSVDPELRNMAIVKHLSSRPLMMLEAPKGLSLSDTKLNWANANLPAQFEMRGGSEWSSKSFEMFIQLQSEGNWSPGCNINSGRLLCVSGDLEVEMVPSEGGVFVGTISTRQVSEMPFVYKYR